jgi:hypothetical protein
MGIRTAFGEELRRLGVTAKSFWPFKLSNNRHQAIINLQNAIAKKNNRLFRNAQPQMKIGSASVNGAIFKMKGASGPRKVMKIVKSPGGAYEFEFQRNASRLGLAPPVYRLVKGVNLPSEVANAFFMNQAGPGKIVKINAFTMNNLQQSNDNKVSNFHNYMKSRNVSANNKNLAMNTLSRMVNKLGNHGISHGDLHPGNVYVVISPGKPPRFLIIDFGRSWRVHSMNTRRTVGTARRVERSATGGVVNDPNYGKLYLKRKSNVPHIPNQNKLNEFGKVYRRRM